MQKENLEQTIHDLKREVERLSAAREIENLVNRYTYKLMAAEFDSLKEFFALKTPGLRIEIGPSGVFEGAEGIERFYVLAENKHFRPPSPGGLTQDYNTTPIIEVAEDGQTAKGLWYTPGINTGVGPFGRDPEGKLQAEWFYQKRAFDFVKEDGEWKIWHYHAYVIFTCTFYTSWADVTEDYVNRSFGWPEDEECKPDKPTTYHKPYYAGTYEVEYVPKAPEPYKTWKDTFSY
jgi:hypothetical protein